MYFLFLGTLCLTVLRGGAMDAPLTHYAVFADMLRRELPILFEYNTYAQQSKSKPHKRDCNDELFHITKWKIIIHNLIARRQATQYYAIIVRKGTKLSRKEQKQVSLLQHFCHLLILLIGR